MGLGAVNIDLGGIVRGIGNIIDDLHTSDEERLEAEYRFRGQDLGVIKGQLEINKAEAQHRSVFVAGWRPFIGWVSGLALAYQFLVYPLLVWGWTLLQANGYVPINVESPPVLEINELMAVVFAMLGVGGMRTYEKQKGIDTRAVATTPQTEKKSWWPWGKK